MFKRSFSMVRSPNGRYPSRQLSERFRSFADPVLQSENMRKTRYHIQHRNVSCYAHSVAVAYYSLALAGFLGIRVDEKILVRGALLHDYFLYDWHEPHGSHRPHGYTHPTTALANARREFDLDAREQDVILRHMFPLTLVPPLYTESWIVCIVDKICSLAEVLGWNDYTAIEYSSGVVLGC